MSCKKGLVGIVAGVAAGVAAGALLGILFAPKKGSETREKIQTITKEYTNVVKDKFNEFLDSIIEKFESAKGEVTELAEKGENQFEEANIVKNALYKVVTSPNLVDNVVGLTIGRPSGYITKK